jgi:pimeloyl-ACP methyl ester carboxylesterase
MTYLGLKPTVRVNTFLTIRGTYVWDVVNNRRNTQVALHPTSICTTCAVHRGFWRNFVALKSIFAQVNSDIADTIDARKRERHGQKLAILGHSMGAVMAQLAMLYLQVVMEGDDTIEGVYALGSPRLGNMALATMMAVGGAYTPTINVITDPAPHFPSRMFGYRHAEPIAMIFVDPVYWALVSAGEKPEVLASGSQAQVYDLDEVEKQKMNYLYHKMLTGADADYKFAVSSPYLSSATHLDYFTGLDAEYLISCGGMADKFVFNNNAMSLFD